MTIEAQEEPNILFPQWTHSYALYHQPHALWLSEDKAVGDNLELLRKGLRAAERQNKIPEFVVYAIPLRDLGQSSDGGFKTYGEYFQENKLIADGLKRFYEKTGIHPRIYLEPDALALAVQYRREKQDSPESLQLYQERIKTIATLTQLYHGAGAKTYLDAAHSGWFDYSEQDLQSIAKVLNDAGIRDADGLVSNVSNRQPLNGLQAQNETHYLQRLLPLLENKHLDVVVDTSRNGGLTHSRLYCLAPSGELIDNETPQGRLVGHWYSEPLSDNQSEIWFEPFVGIKKPLSRLLEKEKYQWKKPNQILAAPPWLDAVGDVQLGLAPSDEPSSELKPFIHRLRFVKPPDECDGALNYPAGKSKDEINRKILRHQTKSQWVDPHVWD